jgi:hypothetical protein
MARLPREPGSERAIDINSMARRLQHLEAWLSAVQLVKPHPLAAEARRVGIIRCSCTA